MSRVHNHVGDSNDQVYRILGEIPPFAYISAFLDIEGPDDLAFSTVAALKANHTSVDAYVLYPTSGLRRLLSYDAAEREKHEGKLTRYFGTDQWRPIAQRRATDARSKQMDRELRGLYMQQLRQHWRFVNRVMGVKGPKGLLYQMIFAFDHEAAGRISESAERSSATYELFDEL